MDVSATSLHIQTKFHSPSHGGAGTQIAACFHATWLRNMPKKQSWLARQHTLVTPTDSEHWNERMTAISCRIQWVLPRSAYHHTCLVYAHRDHWRDPGTSDRGTGFVNVCVAIHSILLTSVATHINLPRRTISGFLTHPSRPSQMGATRALRPRVGATIVPAAGLSRTRIPIQRDRYVRTKTRKHFESKST